MVILTDKLEIHSWFGLPGLPSRQGPREATKGARWRVVFRAGSVFYPLRMGLLIGLGEDRAQALVSPRRTGASWGGEGRAELELRPTLRSRWLP